MQVRFSTVAGMTDAKLFTDSLLLATHSTIGELSLHRVRIDFEKASVSIGYLKLIANCTPTPAITSTTDLPVMMQSHLTTLDFIPWGPESKSRIPTQPFVLTAFSYFSHDFQGGDVANTVLCKWELCLEKPAVHSSFAQLSSKRHNDSSVADLPVS